MKKFLLRLAIYILLMATLIAAYCSLASYANSKYYGVNTEQQINRSFKNSVASNHECYLLGNSRIYRNVNPDYLTAVDAYNFGFDNDSFNQMYYKLSYLLDNGIHPKYLIIGADYSQFSFFGSASNYVYATFFPKEYINDYEDSSWFAIRTNYITTLWKNKQNSLRAIMWTLKGKAAPDQINHQKDNGQYIVYGLANGDEYVDRDYTILDKQFYYYSQIVDICQRENIDLYVVMPPLRYEEIASHTDDERRSYDEMIQNSLASTPFEGHYINYMNENGLSPYTDFTDITHLTPDASDRYSQFLNTRIFN